MCCTYTCTGVYMYMCINHDRVRGYAPPRIRIPLLCVFLKHPRGELLSYLRLSRGSIMYQATYKSMTHR